MPLLKIILWDDLEVSSGLVVAGILVATLLTILVMHKILDRSFRLASLHLNVDPTRFKFFRHIISFLITIVGIGVAVYLIPSLRTLSISLFAGAGILAVVIGFASQAALSNI